MSAKNWTLEEIPWDRFDPSKVDARMLEVVKAASMVEANGGDYATYLCNVFPDDPVFQEAAKAWAEEEEQHGEALARWAELADPTFNFEQSFQRFTEGFRLPLDATQSVRGSRSGELVARCIVEVGTSSYYSALCEADRRAGPEGDLPEDRGRRVPALQAVLQPPQALPEARGHRPLAPHPGGAQPDTRERGRRAGLRLFTRPTITNDEAYERKRWSQAYMSRAYGYYRRHHHVERVVAMTFKAAGLKPQGRLARVAGTLAYAMVRRRGRPLSRFKASGLQRPHEARAKAALANSLRTSW